MDMIPDDRLAGIRSVTQKANKMTQMQLVVPLYAFNCAVSYGTCSWNEACNELGKRPVPWSFQKPRPKPEFVQTHAFVVLARNAGACAMPR